MDRREKPLAALALLILETLAAGPHHGFGIALHVEESSSALLRRSTLTEGVRRVLRWA